MSNREACPFCKSDRTDSVYFNDQTPAYYAIVCLSCGAQGPHGKPGSNEDEERWNKRVGDSNAGYIVVFQCKKALAYDKSVFTKEGEWAILLNDSEGWVPATSTSHRKGDKISSDVKVFPTEEAATNFMKTWKGHPWYHIPNGIFQCVPIIAKKKLAFDRYEVDLKSIP